MKGLFHSLNSNLSWQAMQSLCLAHWRSRCSGRFLFIFRGCRDLPPFACGLKPGQHPTRVTGPCSVNVALESEGVALQPHEPFFH